MYLEKLADAQGQSSIHVLAILDYESNQNSNCVQTVHAAKKDERKGGRTEQLKYVCVALNDDGI